RTDGVQIIAITRRGLSRLGTRVRNHDANSFWVRPYDGPPASGDPTRKRASRLTDMPDFLQLSGKTFLVFGVANKKSVAWFVAKTLEEEGATVLYSVRSEARKKSLDTQLAGRRVFVCDVEHEGAVDRLASEIADGGHTPLHG